MFLWLLFFTCTVNPTSYLSSLVMEFQVAEADCVDSAKRDVASQLNVRILDFLAIGKCLHTCYIALLLVWIADVVLVYVHPFRNQSRWRD